MPNFSKLSIILRQGYEKLSAPRWRGDFWRCSKSISKRGSPKSRRNGTRATTWPPLNRSAIQIFHSRTRRCQILGNAQLTQTPSISTFNKNSTSEINRKGQKAGNCSGKNRNPPLGALFPVPCYYSRGTRRNSNGHWQLSVGISVDHWGPTHAEKSNSTYNWKSKRGQWGQCGVEMLAGYIGSGGQWSGHSQRRESRGRKSHHSETDEKQAARYSQGLANWSHKTFWGPLTCRQAVRSYRSNVELDSRGS